MGQLTRPRVLNSPRFEPGAPIERAARPPGDAWSSIGDRDARDVQFTQIRNRIETSGVRGITSLQFCCAGWALSRGRELSGERPRTPI